MNLPVAGVRHQPEIREVVRPAVTLGPHVGNPRKAGRIGVGHVLYGAKFNHEFSPPAEDRPTWDSGLKAA